jgi:predicted RNase H-like nuclease
MSLVAGVDGCRGGWIVAVAEAKGGSHALLDARVFPTFKGMLAATAACAAVAVDIPIGLSGDCPRAADRAARRFLGRLRSSSVFPAPLRCVLAAKDYVNACVLSQAACGRKLSRQAFNILPKIGEADDALAPADQSRLRESHPEVSFAALNHGRAMQHNKKTPAGRSERALLLTALFEAEASSFAVPSGAARDDLYDACVLTWTASRIARGESASLPTEPQVDARGLRMEIVY